MYVCVCVYLYVSQVCKCVCGKKGLGFHAHPPPPSTLLTLNLFDFVQMCLSIEFLREKEREEVREMGGGKEERAHI